MVNEIIKRVKLIYGEEKIEKELKFKEVSYDVSKEMIVKNHYSHKWNTAFGKINVGVFSEDELLGVASFGNLMNPKSYVTFNKDFVQENVIELNRLWVDDKLGKNTESILLSASWRFLRENYPHIKAVQSFADGRLGCGTIYKATNFDYYGFETSLFYENIETGETFHKVPMENTMRPDGMIKLNTLFIQGKLKPFLVKTYRYIMPLYKDVVIELEKKPYPKYDIGLEYVENYKHNDNTIIKSFILSFLLQYEQFDELLRWISKNANEEQILEQTKNKSIEKIIVERGLEQRKHTFLHELKKMLKNGAIEKTIVVQKKQLDIFDFLGGE